MLAFKYYYKLIIKQDLINKLLYTNAKELAKIRKINLNFGYDNKNFNLKSAAFAMLALELITKQEGKLTCLKNTKPVIKIRKGYPVGCKITLKKTAVYEFFFKLLVSSLPKLKNFYGIMVKTRQTKTLSFKLMSAFIFDELEKQHNIFKNLPTLDVTFVTNTRNPKELYFLIMSHKLPLSLD